jgi:uncharacterized membrane protein
VVKKIKRNSLKTKDIVLCWMKSSKSSKRFVEIDVIRGVAISLMVFGHTLWNLDYFNLLPMNVFIYSLLQKIVPPLFFLVVGFGLVVSRKKKVVEKTQEKEFNSYLFVRGLKVFGLGMLLTIFSFVLIPGRPVLFGVLHFIGLSILLSIFFLRYRRACLLLGPFFILVGLFLSSISFNNPSIFHLIVGLRPSDIWRYTVDYFPLFPWFGVTLLGIGLGNILYDGNKRRFMFPDLSVYRPAKLFSWAGRHSLGIYILHHPVIVGAIYVFGLWF